VAPGPWLACILHEQHTKSQQINSDPDSMADALPVATLPGPANTVKKKINIFYLND